MTIRLVCGVASVCAAAATAGAQRATPAPPCEHWSNPPGESSGRDRSRTPCSLTRRPVPLVDTLTIPVAQATPYYGADVYLAIRPDGTVDSLLTREWSISGIWALEDQSTPRADAMDILRHWRFSAPLAGDTAVRAAFELSIEFAAGPDSVPATAQLRYVIGATRDTLRLVWMPRSALAPGSVREQATAVLVAMAQFRVTRTCDDHSPWTGCFAVAPLVADRASLAVELAARGATMQTTTECGAFDAWRAVTATRISRLDDRTWVVRFQRPPARFYSDESTCRVRQTAAGWRAACF